MTTSDIDDDVFPYTTKQVCDQTGVTYRQLDYWERADILTEFCVPAEGSGSRRRWAPQVLPIVVVLGELSRAVRRSSTATQGAPSVDLLRRIVENFDRGQLILGDHVNILWETTL